MLNKEYYQKEVFTKIQEKFGNRDWTDHKVRLVYDIVKCLTEKEFTKVVNTLVLNYSRSPSGNDVSKLVSEQLELRNQYNKQQHTNDHKMKMANDDQSRFFKLLLTTMANPTENNLQAMHKATDYLASIAPRFKCNKCQDSGTVVAIKGNSEYAFKCFCSEGINNQNAWPVWKNNPEFKIKNTLQ